MCPLTTFFTGGAHRHAVAGGPGGQRGAAGSVDHDRLVAAARHCRDAAVFALHQVRCVQQCTVTDACAMSSRWLECVDACTHHLHRQQEHEADIIGMHLAAQACYDPVAGARVFAKMEQVAKSMGIDKIPTYLRTHPLDKDRIREVRKKRTCVLLTIGYACAVYQHVDVRCTIPWATDQCRGAQCNEGVCAGGVRRARSPGAVGQPGCVSTRPRCTRRLVVCGTAIVTQCNDLLAVIVHTVTWGVVDGALDVGRGQVIHHHGFMQRVKILEKGNKVIVRVRL